MYLWGEGTVTMPRPPVEVQGQFWHWVFFFHRVGPGDRTEAIRPSRKYLYLLVSSFTFVLFLFSETGFLCVALAVLELTV